MQGPSSPYSFEEYAKMYVVGAGSYIYTTFEVDIIINQSVSNEVFTSLYLNGEFKLRKSVIPRIDNQKYICKNLANSYSEKIIFRILGDFSGEVKILSNELIYISNLRIWGIGCTKFSHPSGNGPWECMPNKGYTRLYNNTLDGLLIVKCHDSCGMCEGISLSSCTECSAGFLRRDSQCLISSLNQG